MDEIENAISRAVERERLSGEDLVRMKKGVNDAIEKLQASERETNKNLRADFKRLEAQEARLVDLAADGSITTPKHRERLNYIRMQKAAIIEKLSRTEGHLPYGAELVFAQIALLSNPGDLDKRLPDNVRRDLLGALFSELRVYVNDEDITIVSIRTEVNEAIRQLQAQQHLTKAPHHADQKKRTPRATAKGSS